METIKELYYNHAQNLVKDMPETIEARDDFYKWHGTLDRETAIQAEEHYGAASLYNAVQGFVFGFQYAMQIAGECGLLSKGAGK